jgi:hypothetical protein
LIECQVCAAARGGPCAGPQWCCVQARAQRRETRPPAAPTGVDGDIGRERRSAAVIAAPTGVDRRIASLATRQDGIVERRQLLALGLSAAAIDHRVRIGRLIVLYRGVYAVGHNALSERGTLRAALIAAGPTAMHSHLTAAARWKVTPSIRSSRSPSLERDREAGPA